MEEFQQSRDCGEGVIMKVEALVAIGFLAFFALGVNDVFVGQALWANSTPTQYMEIRNWFLISAIATVLSFFGTTCWMMDTTGLSDKLGLVKI